jgi:endonuclease-3
VSLHILRCCFPEIFRLIKKMNCLTEPEQSTALQKVASEADPFKVLITTILSQRTRDENTRKASAQLFLHYPDIRTLANANVKHVEELIRPSGFYHVKARSIISVAKILMKEQGGIVPRNLDDLLELPSVGRKTANCVLTYGFRIPAIPVDTHVHRIANRLTIVNTRTAKQTESQLRRKVQKRFWLDLNEELVKFGQRICRPIRPRCLVCLLENCCDWYNSHRRTREIIWSNDKLYGRLELNVRCSS